MVSLLDSERFRRDPNANSLAFFAMDANVVVDRGLIDQLVAQSEINGRSNARICLHNSPDANFHEMIILERGGSYFPPHRHKGKGETCHIIQGQVAVFAFDDRGNIKRCAVLGNGSGVIFRVGNEEWHLVLPLTDPAIYHEGKPGPFLGPADREFASWAPVRTDTTAVAGYLEGLRRHAVALSACATA